MDFCKSLHKLIDDNVLTSARVGNGVNIGSKLPENAAKLVKAMESTMFWFVHTSLADPTLSSGCANLASVYRIAVEAHEGDWAQELDNIDLGVVIARPSGSSIRIRA